MGDRLEALQRGRRELIVHAQNDHDAVADEDHQQREQKRNIPGKANHRLPCPL